MKRKPLVVANWKMHGQKAWIESFVKEFETACIRRQKGSVVLCPPFVYLPLLQHLLRDAAIDLGAQNVHTATFGPFTGEVAASMLKECGCTYVIVGHSERRSLYGESDKEVAARFVAAGKGALVPILCVGENAQERNAGTTEQRVCEQLDAVIEFAGSVAFVDAVIAYEPIWAIGTGNTATPEQAQAVHAVIRGHLTARGVSGAAMTRILYGGSVKADNAAALAAEPDIDGALVGGASLVVEDFISICDAFAV